MQAELPDTIAIIGVNEVGKESGNTNFTEGRDLPWLQDTEEVHAWGQWGVSYRDVVLVDRSGKVAGVFNLTENDLGNAGVYQDLVDALLALDSEQQGEE